MSLDEIIDYIFLIQKNERGDIVNKKYFNTIHMSKNSCNNFD